MGCVGSAAEHVLGGGRGVSLNNFRRRRYGNYITAVKIIHPTIGRFVAPYLEREATVPRRAQQVKNFKSFISSRERAWRYLSAASPIGHPKFGPNEHALAGWAGDREKGEASRCGWQRRTGTIWRRRGSTSPCSPPSCVTSTSGSSRVQTGPTAQLSLLHSHDSCASNTRAVIVWSLSLRYAGGRRRGSTLALLVADGTSSTDGVCVPAFFTLLVVTT